MGWSPEARAAAAAARKRKRAGKGTASKIADARPRPTQRKKGGTVLTGATLRQAEKTYMPWSGVDLNAKEHGITAKGAKDHIVGGGALEELPKLFLEQAATTVGRELEHDLGRKGRQARVDLLQKIRDAIPNAPDRYEGIGPQQKAVKLPPKIKPGPHYLDGTRFNGQELEPGAVATIRGALNGYEASMRQLTGRVEHFVPTSDGWRTVVSDHNLTEKEVRAELAKVGKTLDTKWYHGGYPQRRLAPKEFRVTARKVDRALRSTYYGNPDNTYNYTSKYAQSGQQKNDRVLSTDDVQRIVHALAHFAASSTSPTHAKRAEKLIGVFTS